MDPRPVPPIVEKAREVQKNFLLWVLVPFVAYAVLGGAVGLPLAIEAFGTSLPSALGLVAVYMVGLLLAMVPVVSRGNAAKWAGLTLQQWELNGIREQITEAPVTERNEADPLLASMQTMVSRVGALLEPSTQAHDAVEAAARRIQQLLRERDNVRGTLEGLQGTGEGKAALEEAATRLDRAAAGLVDDLASVYAALVARQAAEPAAASAGLKDALQRLQAEAEVAGSLLPREAAAEATADRVGLAKARDRTTT